MLNCINGVYTPQEGSITFRGQKFDHMNSRQVAEMGIARTFQNLALFKGMSVVDNIMTGRNLHIKSNLFLQAPESVKKASKNATFPIEINSLAYI